MTAGRWGLPYGWSHALLKLQVGLEGTVQPSAVTPFPAYQVVDYVRIWKRPLGLATF